MKGIRCPCATAKEFSLSKDDQSRSRTAFGFLLLYVWVSAWVHDPGYILCFILQICIFPWIFFLVMVKALSFTEEGNKLLPKPKFIYNAPFQILIYTLCTILDSTYCKYNLSLLVCHDQSFQTILISRCLISTIY